MQQRVGQKCGLVPSAIVRANIAEACRLSVLSLSIAGLGCRLELAADYTLVEEARDRYKDFVHDGAADIVFRIDHPADRTPPDNPGLGEAERDGEAILFGRNDFRAAWHLGSGEVVVTLIDNVYTFDALLRMFFSLYAVSRRGIMLHSAGLARDGAGYLFVGRSESGKSTLARLASGFIHLTDELTVVLPRERGFAICGTPFWGLFEKGGANRIVPLRYLYHLVRDDRTFLRPISRTVALKNLFACAMNFLTESEWHERILGTLTSLVAGWEPTELHCVPDEAVWELLP